MANPATPRPKKSKASPKAPATPEAQPAAAVASALDISSTLAGAAFGAPAQRITRERVRQLEVSALKRLRKALAERGFRNVDDLLSDQS